jgi:hypothetical protein
VSPHWKHQGLARPGDVPPLVEIQRRLSDPVSHVIGVLATSL